MGEKRHKSHRLAFSLLCCPFVSSNKESGEETRNRGTTGHSCGHTHTHVRADGIMRPGLGEEDGDCRSRSKRRPTGSRMQDVTLTARGACGWNIRNHNYQCGNHFRISTCLDLLNVKPEITSLWTSYLYKN
ncbi:hypothetical protein PoB_000600900 [Plakobranchus ocellatus]|uniref:Secreted protein n=1 Tax=Plakobranchus ocellatus TaxID=259542 RepID=A0AAV3YB42_9GAST|nr:hypothetical protein PoB_000600900 [Plakobranchus ocellatus]